MSQNTFPSPRCKAGDYAIVVGVDRANAEGNHSDGTIAEYSLIAIDIVGTVFKVVSVYQDTDGWGCRVEVRRVKWKGVLNDGRNISGEGDVDICPDRVLMPIRYQEGEDEMVSIMKNKEFTIE